MTADPSDPVSMSTTDPKPLYQGSTQYKNWIYSQHELSTVRHALNAAAVQVIRNTIEEDEPGTSADVSFLTPEEEVLLVKLYISKIPQLCGHFRFPEEVEATAISFLKRFYLKNTVMDWHPKNVMLTTLFLATKTTNHPIVLETYTSNIPKTAPSDVLDLEFLVAQSLGFEFSVWHAHRALWGIWLDLQTLADLQRDQAGEVTQNVYESALAHVRASRLTDVELIYSPSQIALACLSLASPSAASAWSAAKAFAQPNKPSIDATRLTSVIDTIQSIIRNEGQPPSVEHVREVDRRLKLCKNPEKVVGSKAYLKRKEQEERKAEEKRTKKAEDTRKAMEGHDPFGNSIQVVDDDDDDD